MYRELKIAVVIPALNEALSVQKVVVGLLAQRETPLGQLLVDDIVVVDNGSTDGTASLAAEAGARVVPEPDQGYGAACLAGIAALDTPDVIVFVDADHSVVPEELITLLAEIERGAELVIGSRVLGTQARGALTVPQRFGNWLASVLIRLIWKHPVTDLGPFRAVTSSALHAIDMQDRRFGWTVEMQVKAIQRGMRVVEVPVSTRKRIGRSKISGTVKGVVGAALGIFGTLYALWREERQSSASS